MSSNNMLLHILRKNRMRKATECYASCNDHKCVLARRCMGLAGCRESEETERDLGAELFGEIERLTKENTAQMAELATLQGMREEVLHYQREFHRLRAELAAAQARETTRVKAIAWTLEFLQRDQWMDYRARSVAFDTLAGSVQAVLNRALALPQDRSALDAALAEARREGMLAAAGICSKIEDENYALFKGRAPHANHPQRADTYINGVSDGAGTCAEAIRQAAERSGE